MKKILFIGILLFSLTSFKPTIKNPFKEGEWLKFRVHYGLVNAGFATLSLKDSQKNGKSVYHVTGEGWTTGVAKLFFKVNDNYQSYFDKETGLPYHFIRRVDEGGYIISRDKYFDHQKKEVVVIDHKRKTNDVYKINDVQDMLSTLYFLRNKDLSNLKNGEEVVVNLFFDGETNPFKLKLLDREIINTKFGKIRSLKFRPYVQTGRVFKENESVTIWITDDENKIPIRIKASLVIGSLKMELDEYKGLSNPFNIIFNN
ncbi:MAG: DUF3108 domain-containing protein [Flavobacteriaceae bacterium]|nr:DUF3108 domain-containing protein [Flavobacteriaceae bacterium]